MTSVFQTTLIPPRAPPTPAQGYKTGQHSGQQQQQAASVRAVPVDDYERWYTEAAPNNRMVLALRSGIETEIGWALERLCRLSRDDQFVLSAMPGLTDALFEWPDWFVGGGALECGHVGKLFSLPPDLERRRRYALESAFILRNTSLFEVNALELAGHPRARTLILFALHRLATEVDANSEFLLYVIEILQSISVTLILPPPNSPLLANPLPPLEHLAERSSNRGLILTSLSTLTLLLANPANAGHLNPGSPALNAAVRYLALFASDRELAEVSLNYLYSHLAHPATSKAFLLHPGLSATLRLLALILKSEQAEKVVVVPVGGQVHLAPVTEPVVKHRELTSTELEQLVGIPEPERCLEWLKIMFVENPEAETTQVDLWNLYRSTFTVPGHPAILQAQEVIKNASNVFGQASAMVLPGAQQRFVVRGIERASEKVGPNLFRCRWSNCEQGGDLTSTSELYDHLLEAHIDHTLETHMSCSWGSCSATGLTKSIARRHVLTHLPAMQPPPRHPAQPESITLPYEGYPHPVPDPTIRPPPPPRHSEVSHQSPISDPPSNALTALLCIRVLFRTAFASSDAAPRVDEDHFGFPGIVEDTPEEDEEDRRAETETERDGERRGRKAFIGVRHLLEEVRIRDEILGGWITEMVEAGVTGTT
ncbi:hypothetical protein EUX98_g751 [Antrodiella citrinella]|uniref:RFX-type winged-helix domain-containing protein n=1 Tax=Antrodiella citrinella TaxID=2447956 RepID=A0A4S4N357_9APHY|nr:hypothetical protein EUX98_g751 [Antrodiella citrinella]